MLILATFFVASAIKTATILSKNKGAVLSIPLLKKENGIPVDVIKISHRVFPIDIPMALVENGNSGYQSFVTPKMHSQIHKGQIFKQTGSDTSFEVKSVSLTPDANANLHIVDFTPIKGKVGLRGPIKGKLTIDQVRDALWIPSSSVKRDNDTSFVYIISDGIAKKSVVETGKENDVGIIITKGVKPDDLVVIRGLSELSDGAKAFIHDSQARL